MIRNLKVNPIQIFFFNVFIQCVLSESYYVKASCNIPDSLKKEIESYETAVQKIIEYTVSGPFKGKTYDELAKFVDTFGSRLSGTENLENAIDYMVNRTRQEGLDNIVTEEVKVPYWMRCNEKLTMILPRVKNIELLSLGYSVSTPLGGITAEVVVVPDFETLENMSEDYVRGKIVLFNPTFTTYAETVKYRTNGAVKAAEKGAVAALVRSITPFSLSTPHTGTLSYDEHIKKIPYASITIEDSELIKRITDRGIKVILSLDITSKLETRLSRNTLIDLEGTEAPEKLVIVSGHIDSWDVGQGAMDDGGGMFVSWAAPIILKKLNLTPKRTIRTIFWTAEELGLIGAYAYEKAHRNESHNINFIMESDEGTFAPLGLAVGGTDDTRCIIAYVLDLFERINATALVKDDAPGSDIAIFTSNGIPGASLYNANDRYFWYHHTEADTMTVEDPHELDLGAAFWTAAAYIIADLSIDMPR